MKKTKFGLLFALSGAMILSSCGGAAQGPAKYKFTFKQTVEGDNEDVTVVVTVGKTVINDLWDAEPEINPKTGYDAEWDYGDFNIEEMKADFVLEPTYTAIEYTATFIDRVTNQTIGTDKFTVEDDSLDYPALPKVKGYTYAWESVTISAQDLTVYCGRTANQHTVKFYADAEKTQQVGETLTFSIETTSLVLPSVPVKDGYDGSWPAIDFGCDQDLELVAEYALHSYYIQFKVNGENVGNPVGYNVTQNWGDIEKPEGPSITGYTLTWPEDVTLELKEQDNPQVVEGTYVANKYKVTYEGSSKVTEVTYGEAYTLEGPGSLSNWYYNDEVFAPSGEKWQIASDIKLTKKDMDLRIVDFEDGTALKLFSAHHSAVLSISDDGGINNSKALKVVSSGDTAGSFNFNILKAYVDKVFEDESVKSLSFYAKGNTPSTTFQSRAGSKSYEQKSTGFGVSTEYKLFYLTRDAYNSMVEKNDYMFVQYAPGGDSTSLEMYFDNFKPCTSDYTTRNKIGLEQGRYYQNDDKSWYYRDPINNQADFQVTTSSGVISESALDYSDRSEGAASVKVVKAASGTVNYVLGNSSTANYRLENLPDEGIFVDFKSDNKWNEGWHKSDGTVGAGSIGTGKSTGLAYPFAVNAPSSQAGVQNEAGEWQTFHLKKSEINGGVFMVAGGGATGTMHIDNIRLATLPLESFEDAYAFNAGLQNNVVAGASSYAVSETIGTIPGVLNKCDYIFTTEWGNVNEGAIPSAEITNEKSSEGNYSLKLSLPGIKPLRLRRSYLQMLLKDGGSLSFDVYSDDLADDKLSLTTLGGNVKTITKGTWTTITLTAADFLKTGATEYERAGRFTEKAFGKGTIYVDNIKYIPAE